MMSQQKKVRYSKIKSIGLSIPILMLVIFVSMVFKHNIMAESGTVQVERIETNLPSGSDDRFIPTRLPTTGNFTSPFGDRLDPFTGAKKFHRGIDISNNKGTPIFSPLNGVVTFAERKSDYGLLLVIDHGQGVITRYGQLSKFLIGVGEVVSEGQKIALMGSSGRSTGPHLHYEVIVNGQQVDPIKYAKSPKSYIRDPNSYLK